MLHICLSPGGTNISHRGGAQTFSTWGTHILHTRGGDTPDLDCEEEDVIEARKLVAGPRIFRALKF